MRGVGKLLRMGLKVKGRNWRTPLKRKSKQARRGRSSTRSSSRFRTPSRGSSRSGPSRRTPVRSRIRQLFRRGGSQTRAAVGDRERRVQFTEAADFTKCSKSGGRLERHTLRAAWKHIRAGCENVTLRFQAIRPFYGTTPNGALVLANHYTDGGAGNTVAATWPLHVYDVTSFITRTYVSPVSTVLNVAKPAYVMKTNNTSSTNQQLSFAYLSGQEPLATSENLTSNTWQIEESKDSNTDVANSFDWKRDIFKWMEVKFMFYGRQAQATKFTVELVQLTAPDWCHPEYLASQSNSTSVGNTVADRNFIDTLWTGHVYGEAYSPVATLSAARLSQKYFKIIKRHSFVIQGSTSPGEVGPVNLHRHQMNLFHRFNRMQKYDWQPQGVSYGAGANAVQPDKLMTDPAYPPERGTLNPYVHPHARIYLIVKATSQASAVVSTDPITSGLPSTRVSDWPSYDINLRVRHETVI